jgi:hypothetical protein
MTDTPIPLTGGCLCGAVRFTVSAPLLGAAYCHCKRCQRRTGGATSITGLTQQGSFEITDGEAEVGSYDPADGGWVKSFCGQCGSQLYTSNPENPDLIAVRLGTFDADPGVRPGARQFVDYAAPWEPIPDDGLPRFGERLTWEGDRPADL